MEWLSASITSLDNVCGNSRSRLPDHGTVSVVMIDAQRPDRTTLQHGIAWRVNNRLVGHCGWRGSDYEKILDGRTSEAKRYTFIVFADLLAHAVLPDWSDFGNEAHPAWQATRAAVQARIRETILEFVTAAREETKRAIRDRYRDTVEGLPGQSRERVGVVHRAGHSKMSEHLGDRA